MHSVLCAGINSRRKSFTAFKWLKTAILFAALACIFNCHAQTSAQYLDSGLTKAKAGDYRGALAGFTMAIKADPKNADAYFNRANVKSHLADYEGAIADYTSAIGINPGMARAWYNRGLIKHDLEDHLGALDDYNKAIMADPQYANAYGSRGLEKLYINQKDSGCADLIKATSLGDTTAPSLIKKFCN